MNIIIAILIFGIIIIVHELGHFLIAKKNGIQVDEFCVGLGPTIIGKQIGDTFYSLKLLPFGGACMMGEDEDRPEKNAFNNKSVWARMAVIFGGPFFNFILAFVLSLLVVGISGVDLPKIHAVAKNSPAASSGLKAGDIMTSVDGQKIHNYREFSYYMYMDYQGGKIPLTVDRNGKEKSISVTPEYSKKNQQYMIGITWPGKQKVGPLKTIEYSFREVGLQIKITIKSLKMLITRQLGVKDLSGPVGIVKTVGDQYNQASHYGALVVFLTMMNMAILISANLGVMNLLPLPALDGGRLLFLILEAIRRKPVPKNMEAAVHTAGLLILMALMVFVMYQDIVKIFF
ncbi:RIP metalloprotease RseP [Anaerostipes sp.]|uniref:RIP metalloprotease RseP n=1 Tax=Anaerostipes sp. TaxID=1872530 RepID=UPI003FED6821